MSRMRSKSRAAFVFATQANDMGVGRLRTIALLWARARIGMKSLAENMRHLDRCPT